MRRTNIIGERFGQLVVLEQHYKKSRRSTALCLCDCGNKKEITQSNLKTGTTTSCGCYAQKVLLARSVRHGQARVGKISSEHYAWTGMFTRCYNPNSEKYADYGGRGIKICARWRKSFEAFYVDMGTKPSPKHSLDRIDVNGNYCKSNCRWATAREQANNTRRNVKIEYKGEVKTISQWAERLGIAPSTLRMRLAILKWPIEKALTTPLARSVGKSWDKLEVVQT